MKTIGTINGNSFVAPKLFFGLPARQNYVWKNIIIEKRVSFNLIDSIYQGSVIKAFWKVLTSPVN